MQQEQSQIKRLVQVTVDGNALAKGFVIHLETEEIITKAGLRFDQGSVESQSHLNSAFWAMLVPVTSNMARPSNK